MNDSGRNSFFDRAFRIGTPECAVFCAVLAMVLGLLLLWVGFWNTVLIFLLMLLGAFIGGVKNKKQWIKTMLNRVIPDRKSIPYREQHPEIVKAVREATGKARTDDGTDEE